eukprot:10265_1
MANTNKQTDLTLQKLYIVQMTNSARKKMVHVENNDGNTYVLYNKHNIQKRFILLVNGWIHQTKFIVIQDLKDLILFYFAKPLIMNFNHDSKIDYILLCPIINDNFKSIQQKLIDKIQIGVAIELQYGNIKSEIVSEFNNNYKEFGLNETEIYKVRMITEVEYRNMLQALHKDTLTQLLDNQAEFDEIKEVFLNEILQLKWSCGEYTDKDV